MMDATYDVGSPPPPADVIGLRDYTDGECRESAPWWGRVVGDSSTWKGYKDGGKVYLSWPELTRRWGPLTVSRRSSS